MTCKRGVMLPCRLRPKCASLNHDCVADYCRNPYLENNESDKLYFCPDIAACIPGILYFKIATTAAHARPRPGPYPFQGNIRVAQLSFSGVEQDLDAPAVKRLYEAVPFPMVLVGAWRQGGVPPPPAALRALHKLLVQDTVDSKRSGAFQESCMCELRRACLRAWVCYVERPALWARRGLLLRAEAFWLRACPPIPHSSSLSLPCAHSPGAGISVRQTAMT